MRAPRAEAMSGDMSDIPLKLARLENGAPEVFRSFQGEGPMAGQLRAFVRFSGCNLHCRWCDTAYTWNWRSTPHAHDDAVKFDPAREVEQTTVDLAFALIEALPAPGVVVTGGEPMMQPRALLALIKRLKSNAAARHIELETNGSFAPEPALTTLVDLFMVSPKLAHSGNEEGLAEAAIGRFAGLPRAQFKFVGQSAENVATVARLTEAHGVAPDRVWMMPEGRTVEAIDRSWRALWPAAQEQGFNITDRLHIRLMGEKRGI